MPYSGEKYAIALGSGSVSPAPFSPALADWYQRGSSV